MKVWCYDDVHEWGAGLANALRAGPYKHELIAQVFNDARQPDTGFVMWHMHHHPSVRHVHKRAMQHMSMNPKLTLWPSYQTSILFDDKLEQARQLARFMPPTQAFFTPKTARNYLDNVTYPFVSKALDGVSSANVRIIEGYKQASEEIKYAFSDRGIRCRNSQAQRGYLLWQEMIPDCDYDIRVMVVGGQRLMLKRFNKALDASGVRTEPCAPEHFRVLDPVLMGALKAAEPVIQACHMNLGLMDFLYDEKQGRYYLLEVTASWSMHGFNDCYFVNAVGEVVTQKDQPVKGQRLWEVVASEMHKEFKSK